VQFIDADEVNATLTFPVLVDALEEAHRRPPIVIEDTMIGDHTAMYFVRNAVDPGRFAASKLITSIPANNERGHLPAIQAVVVIFDGDDGRPLAVIDGTSLTQWRTAADSALGSRWLSRPDSRTLLVLGTGAMAKPLVRAHCSVRPSIDRVLVWNHRPEGAARLVAELTAEGFRAEVAPDIAAALGVADVVTAATRAVDPVIHGADLRPGMHVDLVGGFTPATREIDDAGVAMGRLFVDRRESAMDVGDVIGPIENGTITIDGLLGDLHDLVAGRVGRVGPEDVTIFKNAGGGHLDLFTAETILRVLGSI
jgi:ornithine cyclodeaminase/alanine dehydrogenase-like protein (mu-crystallin family)